MIFLIADKCIPKTTMRSRKKMSWLLESTLKLIRVKHRMYKVAKRTMTEKDWNKYKSVRNKLRDCTRRDHQSHLQDICDNLHTDQRSFWRWLKNVKCQQAIIPPLTVMGKTVTGIVDKANALNNYFVSVFTRENKQDMERLKAMLASSRKTVCMEDFTVEKSDVYKQLCQIDPSKSSGPDGIPGRLLTEGATQLAEPLTKVFNMSLQSGDLPNDWKKGNITPIYKKGDKHKPSNYRPISLTSLVVKVLERILHNHIMEFVEKTTC